tara:strand:+ start:547 stop:744 length:198 start_codon:yes stop_codon:yes gene_type:complete
VEVLWNKIEEVIMAKKTKLTARQQTALDRHAKHHTSKHMAMMRREMRSGSTFTEAHKKAKKKVGK